MLDRAEFYTSFSKINLLLIYSHKKYMDIIQLHSHGKFQLRAFCILEQSCEALLVSPSVSYPHTHQPIITQLVQCDALEPQPTPAISDIEDLYSPEQSIPVA